MFICVFSTLRADGLALLYTRVSAGTVMAKVVYRIHTRLALEELESKVDININSVDGLVQDCSTSGALQSFTDPSMWTLIIELGGSYLIFSKNITCSSFETKGEIWLLDVPCGIFIAFSENDINAN